VVGDVVRKAYVTKNGPELLVAVDAVK
jgi:hypothetical protein